MSLHVCVGSNFGTTVKTAKNREKYWKAWQHYTSKCGTHPFLSRSTTQAKELIICAFVAWIRSGALGRGYQIHVQGVTDALAAVGKTFQLAGYPSPIHRSTDKYTVMIEKLTKGYQCQDPPSTPQLAVPVTVPNLVLTNGCNNNNPKEETICCLTLIAFYHLLRGCTSPFCQKIQASKSTNHRNL